MIPTVVSSQLRDTVAEYLRTTFSLRDQAYERALPDYASDQRGPFETCDREADMSPPTSSSATA